jgi:hypothetical protein
VARKSGRLVRVFEWIEVEPDDIAHFHALKSYELDGWFHTVGRVEPDLDTTWQPDRSGTLAWYAVFEGDGQ